jgi:hypothetical protein
VGNRLFFTGFSGESLGLLRAWLGFTAIVYCLFQFATLLILDPLGPGFYYIEPIWYFGALGIDHHIPWLTPVAVAVLVAACVCVSRGTRTRLSIAVLLLTILYLKGVRDSIAGDVHHRMLIPFHMLLILLLSRSGDVLSADARRKRTVAPLAEWEASWPIRAMQAYLAFFYFFGAIAKIRVSGLVWFGGGRIQDLLISRSVGLAHDVGEWSFRRLSWEMAQIPDQVARTGPHGRNRLPPRQLLPGGSSVPADAAALLGLLRSGRHPRPASHPTSGLRTSIACSPSQGLGSERNLNFPFPDASRRVWLSVAIRPRGSDLFDVTESPQIVEHLVIGLDSSGLGSVVACRPLPVDAVQEIDDVRPVGRDVGDLEGIDTPIVEPQLATFQEQAPGVGSHHPSASPLRKRCGSGVVVDGLGL